jgi:molybdate transport system substrate-binding protein
MKLLSTLGVIGVLDGTKAQSEAVVGGPIEMSFDPTLLMLERIAKGERADVAILTTAGVEILMKEGVLVPGSRVDLARSLVGLAVKAGAAKPDLSTVEATKKALVDARSVVYSRKGQSGIFFAGLIERLGIAEAVNRRAIIVESGTTAGLVANGEAEIAVQQVSELMIVPGIDIAGPLPDEIQDDLVFAGAVFTDSAKAAVAARLLEMLASRDLAELYRQKGLQPIAAG